MTYALLGSELFPRRKPGGSGGSQQVWPLPRVPPPAPSLPHGQVLERPPPHQPRADLKHKDLCSFLFKK